MQFEGLRDVRFVRTPSFVYILMSCAPYILRSAFRLIRSREIFFSRPSLTKIIGCSSLIYRWYAFGWTERDKFSQSAVRLVRRPSLFTLIMSCAPCIQNSAFRSIGNREICQQAKKCSYYIHNIIYQNSGWDFLLSNIVLPKHGVVLTKNAIVKL